MKTYQNNLYTKEMVFDVDFEKAYGKKGQIQGDYGTHVEVNNSGKNIVLTYTDPDNPDVATEADHNRINRSLHKIR